MQPGSLTKTTKHMFIKAKFNSKCAQTRYQILKGDSIFWDKHGSRLAYCMASARYKTEQECTSTANYINAQENAYYDNFSHQNRY